MCIEGVWKPTKFSPFSFADVRPGRHEDVDPAILRTRGTCITIPICPFGLEQGDELDAFSLEIGSFGMQQDE
jgi:hypothetical protein